MQARGPLMIEHRLIERMISIIQYALTDIASTEKIDPIFVDTVVDFVRVYADRTHHGKEEDILFRELRDIPLSDEDQRVMQELIDEHVLGRNTTKAIVEANNRYRNGEESASWTRLRTILGRSWNSIRSTSKRRTRSSFRQRGPTSPKTKTRTCWRNSTSLIAA